MWLARSGNSAIDERTKMKRVLQLGLLILLLAIAIAMLFNISKRAAFAQTGPPELFAPIETNQPLLGTDDLGVIRYRAMRLNLPALERARAELGNSRSFSVVLNLFGDVFPEAVLERIEQRPNAEVYFGRLKDVDGSFVHLAITQGHMAASVATLNNFYAVRYAGNGLHLAQEINRALMLPDLDPIPVTSDANTQAATADDGSLIDLMVIYTTAARDGAGGTAAIESLINLGVSETNTAYANSQVIERLRLVHTAEVNYTESGNSSTDLSRLRATSDGFMDEVHGLRDAFKADIVTLIINSSNDGACGVGYLMAGVNPGFASSAFNVTRRSCVSPNYTFGHEIGHNQGLNHAREDPTGTGAFSYSYGYKDTSSLFRTVMAYNCSSGCPRVLHFSNPAVNYNGRPTGVSSDLPNSADNAQSLNNTRVTVANFRVSGGGSSGLMYYPLPAPVRLLDTRPGFGACNAPGIPLAGQGTISLAARGSCGGATIPANAQAVVGNATVANFISGGGYITLYPSNAGQPNASNLNFTANHIVPNSFTVGLGGDGAFKIFSSAATHFVVDITGYYAPPGAGGLYYHPLPSPVRLFESRPGEAGCENPGAPLGDDSTRTVLAHRTCFGATIPSSARAIAGNATVVNFISSGFHWITLYPFGAPQPNVSNLNFSDNQIVPNSFVVGLSTDGRFNIYSHAATHFIIDVTGYFSPEANDVNGQGLLYNPLPAPVRLLETRPGGIGCDAPGTPLGDDATRTQTAHRTCFGTTIPTSAKAVVGNATVVNFISSGFHWITLYPFGSPQPTASNLNYHENQIVPNAFVVGLSSDGRFNIYSHASTHFIVDLSGYYAP
jgi:hypothetical protein